MKVGDKILCIKNREKINLKNNTYTIQKIDIDKNQISISVETNQYHICCHYIYQPSSKMNKKYYYIFEDYFATKKEIRKQKIQKLNEKTK
jgi:hypothetical protein